ncbi:hypothetical protein Sjap_002566 [Stephania japonica]|uniref:Uncharacterized protein n=1 Tax=Stephania japonica TaxID=461633 RepID=A0AAP0KMB7_9MAGN
MTRVEKPRSREKERENNGPPVRVPARGVTGLTRERGGDGGRERELLVAVCGDNSSDARGPCSYVEGCPDQVFWFRMVGWLTHEKFGRVQTAAMNRGGPRTPGGIYGSDAAKGIMGVKSQDIACDVTSGHPPPHVLSHAVGVDPWWHGSR